MDLIHAARPAPRRDEYRADASFLALNPAQVSGFSALRKNPDLKGWSFQT